MQELNLSEDEQDGCVVTVALARKVVGVHAEHLKREPALPVSDDDVRYTIHMTPDWFWQFFPFVLVTVRCFQVRILLTLEETHAVLL